MSVYNNGKIYTIRCKKVDTLIYVGSTIQSLHQRWAGHKKHSKTRQHLLLYSTIVFDQSEFGSVTVGPHMSSMEEATIYRHVYGMDASGYPIKGKVVLDEETGETVIVKRTRGRKAKIK